MRIYNSPLKWLTLDFLLLSSGELFLQLCKSSLAYCAFCIYGGITGVNDVTNHDEVATTENHL